MALELLSQQTITLKIATRNPLPRCFAFELRILHDSIRIRLKTAVHLRKKFLAAIFSVIVYCAHSKILQNVANYRSVLIIFRMATRSLYCSITGYVQRVALSCLTLHNLAVYLSTMARHTTTGISQSRLQ